MSERKGKIRNRPAVEGEWSAATEVMRSRHKGEVATPVDGCGLRGREGILLSGGAAVAQCFQCKERRLKANKGGHE